MHKIVIITDYSEKGDKLIECLSVLFPECEIQIVPKRAGSFENLQAAPGPAEKQSPEDRAYDDQQKSRITKFTKTVILEDKMNKMIITMSFLAHSLRPNPAVEERSMNSRSGLIFIRMISLTWGDLFVFKVNGRIF